MDLLQQIPRKAVSGAVQCKFTPRDAQPVVQVYFPNGTWSMTDLHDESILSGEVDLQLDAFSSGMAVALQSDDYFFEGNDVLMYCGGINEYDDILTNNCT